METEFDTDIEFRLKMDGFHDLVKHARKFGIEDGVIDTDGPMNFTIVTIIQILSSVLCGAAFSYVFFFIEWFDMYQGLCF